MYRDFATWLWVGTTIALGIGAGTFIVVGGPAWFVLENMLTRVVIASATFAAVLWIVAKIIIFRFTSPQARFIRLVAFFFMATVSSTLFGGVLAVSQFDYIQREFSISVTVEDIIPLQVVVVFVGSLCLVYLVKIYPKYTVPLKRRE